MRTKNFRFTTFPRLGLSCMAALGLTLLAVGQHSLTLAQASKPKTFSSPPAAASALFQAAQRNDESALETILGCGEDVTSSNDPVEDKLEREQFIQKYQEMHRLVREPGGGTVLYIGAENWPFPIPLASKSGAWYFDADAGKKEILFRRIGENEATAIHVLEEFAIARKNDSVKADSEDPITRFAEELVSAGAANTYNNDSQPFHGYYFRIVRDPAAADIKKARVLTLVAYPAEYRSSGVMTFVVSHHGTVHQKDLGPNTTTAAPQINATTGQGWQPVG
jgi:DUF2950 family protein